MTLLSFSTMWAQQERFRDMALFRHVVAGFGFDGIEVSHSTDEDGLAALLTEGELPLTSLHAPAPRRKLRDGRLNGDANLAALDEDERREAIEETRRTIEVAAKARLRKVVLHLGGVGNVMTDAERRLRRLVEEDQADCGEADALREQLQQWRSDQIEPYLETAARSLKELVGLASPHGIALGVESRLHFHEIPHPREALYLLNQYDNEVAGYWHDVGHCEVQARLGLIDREEWFPRLTDRTIGVHLHDVDGILDHRAPGNGDVDWAYIAEGLPDEALRVFEIDQRQPDDKVAASIDFLREQGVV